MSRDAKATLKFFYRSLFAAWPEALPLSTFNVFLFLQPLVGLISGVSQNFLKLSSHEMDHRIEKANRQDISSPGFNASSNEKEIDYIYTSQL